MNEEILIDDSKCQELLFNSLKYNWFIILVLDTSEPRLLFFDAPKSLQMVSAAMKLKDTYSLEGQL